MRSKLLALKEFARQHPRKAGLYAAASFLGLIILFQIFYPNGRMLPFMTVDEQNFSAWDKADASWQLNRDYADKPIPIYYGSQQKPHQQPKPETIGLEIANDQRVDDINYSWWLRLVPASILWAHAVVEVPAPAYQRDGKKLESFIDDRLGDSCDVDPTNANLKVNKDKIEVVPSQPGGTCDLEDVKSALSTVKPILNEKVKVQVAVDEIPAKIQDDEAAATAQEISDRLSSGLPLKVKDEIITVSRDNLYDWLVFENQGDKILARFDAKKAQDYFSKNVAPKVVQQPGVTTIATTDFVVTSRDVGEPGTSLNLTKTLDSMASYANQSVDVATVAVNEVPAKVVYKRKYSPTDAGLSALITQYANDNKGEFGISLIELSGQRRRANTNGDKQFVSASTYKLYVAYSTLKRVEDGKFKWSDQISGGRDLATCLNDMISVSDNACAEALVKKIGYRPLTDEAVALGAKNTTFVDEESYKTTANDLAIFVAALESGQLLSSSSNNRLLIAMKNNIYRQGIPAGTNATVANKVGFLDGYLHDAGVVYSPNGKYALAIMTNKSSWAKIAELTKKLEELRSR